MIIGAFNSLAINLLGKRVHTPSLCGVALCVLCLFLGMPWESVTMYSLTFCAGSLFCGVVLGVSLGDNCIQNFHLGRYIVGYTVGNLVLRRRASGAVKRDFRTYIRRYTSPNENFEYGYPHSNAFLQFWLKLERCKPYKIERHPTICDVINDVKLFPTVYHRINCRKFLTLSNQMSRYKSKCIRI